MKFLFKNLFISSFVCFVFGLILHYLGKYVITFAYDQKVAQYESYRDIFLTTTILFSFIFWPLIQTVVIVRLYGFKSILSKILCFILLTVSIPIGWKTFFTFLNGSTYVTLLSQTGLYLTILTIQIFLFFIFVKRSRE